MERQLNPPSFYDDSMWTKAKECCYECDKEIGDDWQREPIAKGTKLERIVIVCKECIDNRNK